MNKLVVFCAVAAAGFSVPAIAGSQDFTLLNNTGYPIERVYVSASDTGDWEEDVLGEDMLADGGRTKIRFDADEDSCLWDIKVVYEDGDDAAWQGVDLCKISVVSLRYDQDSGKTWADSE